jgi:hypothetical protein
LSSTTRRGSVFALFRTTFFTVIAMNQANDASKAVCSDGVTIVTTKPSVKNVVLNITFIITYLYVNRIFLHVW